MDKRLCTITVDQVNGHAGQEPELESLDSVLVGVALGCLSYLLPAALFCAVTYTKIDLFLALALTLFIHAEV